jgi:4-amino-4-deoxy-L-arabinose transferase-like glycosyltransferase
LTAGVAAALAAAGAAPWLFWALGSAPFDDPGEGLHAQIARELLAAADPLALTLGGVRYVDKPPLLHALLAGAFAVAGPSEFVARAVPALGALAAVAATAWLGARLGGARLGLLAGAALLTSCGFFAYGRYVRPETIFVGALAWGLALAVAAVAERRPPLGAGALVCFGVASLAKDPLGALAPPLAIVLTLALGGRCEARWLRPSPPGLAAWLVIGFGWWAAVSLTTPGFAWYTVVDNHVLNVARARAFPDEDVPLGAAAFLTVALLGATPWTPAAALAVGNLVGRRAWRDASEAPWVALALWAVGVLGLSALSPFRLPHYGLPAYPALALLAARAWCRARGRTIGLVHAAWLVGLGTACALAWGSGGAGFAEHVLAATDVATRKAASGTLAVEPPPWETFRPLVGLGALVWLGAGALAAALAARPRAAALAVVGAGLAVLPLTGAALGAVAAHRTVRAVAADIAAEAGPDDLLIHEGPLENSGALEWYAGRRPVIVDGRRSVLAFGATLPGAEGAFWTAERVRRAWTGDRRVWLVTVRAAERSIVPTLPGARLVRAAGGRRLYVNR